MILQIVAVVIPWLLLGVACWLLVQILQKYGQILLRVEALEARVASGAQSGNCGSAGPTGLAPGTVAPAFELPDLSGQVRRLEDWRGQNVLLVFFNIRCGFCVKMADQLAGLPAEGGDGHPAIVLVCAGEADENRSFMEQHGIRCPVLLQKENEVSGPYRAAGTPTGYLIDAGGAIASPLAVGAEDLLAVARTRLPQGEAAPAEPHETQAAEGAAPKGKANRGLQHSRLRRDGLKAGETAPDFRLPKIDGGEVALADYRGRKVLLVFSDPECGPCMEVAPKLEQFHREGRGAAVLMISRRGAEANRQKMAELGLTFPVVLQKHWEVSLLYGMFSTPIAYVIDEQGVLATDVVVGGQPIADLLGRLTHPSAGAEANGAYAESAAT